MKKYKVGDILIWKNFQWTKHVIGRQCKIVNIEDEGNPYDYRVKFLTEHIGGNEILPVYEKELTVPSKLELALQ